MKIYRLKTVSVLQNAIIPTSFPVANESTKNMCVRACVHVCVSVSVSVYFCVRVCERVDSTHTPRVRSIRGAPFDPERSLGAHY